MTHTFICKMAHRWVLRSGFGVAFRELTCNSPTGEIPDVIGFGSFGFSIVIEAKTSLADFRKDSQKPFRLNPEKGMGSQRFFACKHGLITPDMLPDGWGLLYVAENGRVTIEFDPWGGPYEKRRPLNKKNLVAEHGLLYSALRRISKSNLPYQ